MRRSGIFVGSIVALGLATIVAAQADEVTANGQKVLNPIIGDTAVSARKAEQVWPNAIIDNETHMNLVLSGSTVSSDEIGAQLAAIAPAAGPEVINPDGAILALKQMSHDAVAILNDAQLSHGNRTAKFHGLMKRDFDMPLMARFALGRHWKRADAQQRTAYVEAFSKFLLHNYATKIAGAKLVRFDVLKAKRAGKRDVMVQSRVVRGNGQVLKLVWRMRHGPGLVVQLHRLLGFGCIRRSVWLILWRLCRPGTCLSSRLFRNAECRWDSRRAIFQYSHGNFDRACCCRFCLRSDRRI